GLGFSHPGISESLFEQPLVSEELAGGFRASNPRSDERSSLAVAGSPALILTLKALRHRGRPAAGSRSGESDHTRRKTGLCVLVDHVGLQFTSLLQGVAHDSEK